MPTASAVTFRATQITIYDWSNRHQRPCHRTSEYLPLETPKGGLEIRRAGARYFAGFASLPARLRSTYKRSICIFMRVAICANIRNCRRQVWSLAEVRRGRRRGDGDCAHQCPAVCGQRNGQRLVDAAAVLRTSTNAPYSSTAPSPTPAACATGPGPGCTVLRPGPPPGAGTPRRSSSAQWNPRTGPRAGRLDKTGVAQRGQ